MMYCRSGVKLPKIVSEMQKVKELENSRWDEEGKSQASRHTITEAIAGIAAVWVISVPIARPSH